MKNVSIVKSDVCRRLSANIFGKLAVGHGDACSSRSRFWGLVRGGRVKVCGIEEKTCGFRGALYRCFAMLVGVALSLLYSHEPRVGCHIEGDAVCVGLLQTTAIGV